MYDMIEIEERLGKKKQAKRKERRVKENGLTGGKETRPKRV
jgi:hypothetical protein